MFQSERRTLDNRTCKICGKQDGKVYAVDDAKTGDNYPPFHPRCRCTTVAVFDDEEACESEETKRAARDVLSGESFEVPGDMTYEQWKKQQDAFYGQGTVDKAQKVRYNEKEDEQQLAMYQELLGNKGSLKGLESFRNLKYNDPEGYAALEVQYADKKIQRQLLSDPAYTTLKLGQQGKHIRGHNNYIEGRSYLTVTMEEAQELVRKYAGTGTLKRDNAGNWTHKEFVTADKIIGYVLPLEGGNPIPTKRFSIIYATGEKKGAHIVPAKES